MKYVMAVLLTIFCSAAAFAEPGYREVAAGNSAFGKGDFTSAVGSYQKAGEKNPSQAAIDYDLGTAYYKAGEYDKAVESLQKGLLSDDLKVVTKAHFNLGNALYKAGTAREDKDIGGAIKSLESALPHYDKVIAQDPKDTAASANRDFVKKEIDRLKKKQQEQKQQQQQKKDQSSSSGQSGQEGQSGQQDQKQQDQKQQDQQAQQGSQSQAEQQDQSQKQDQPQAGQGSGSDQKKDQPENSGKPEGSQQAPSQGEDQKGSSSPEKDSASSGQAAQGQILSQKEAKTLLDDFDQNEQPKGLLNFIQRQGNERPVEKDW